MMRVFLAYREFRKWYSLPINAEQLFADLGVTDYLRMPSLEKIGINQLELNGQVYEYLDYLIEFGHVYNRIQDKNVTESELSALVECFGIYEIRNIENYYFYDNAESYVEKVLSAEDRVRQSKSGIVVEIT